MCNILSDLNGSLPALFKKVFNNVKAKFPRNKTQSVHLNSWVNKTLLMTNNLKSKPDYWRFW